MSNPMSEVVALNGLRYAALGATSMNSSAPIEARGAFPPKGGDADRGSGL
jgi:hypothetical protein